MKTSNKILIGLLATIFLSITAILVDVRVFGVHRSNYRIAKHVENYPLIDYKHIMVIDSRNARISPSVTIEASDQNQISIESHSDTLVYAFEHQIVDDTLVIKSIAEIPFMHSLKIQTNANIESISTKGANIRLQGLHQDNIKMFLNRGEINSWGKDQANFSKFNKATIFQVNSRLNFQNLEVDTLEITMDKSSAGFKKEISFVDASIKNISNLDLKHASHLIMKKDSGSKLYMR